jgi:hypothetical protein
MTPPAAAAARPVPRARTTAPGRPLTASPKPRRVSGPARPRRATPAVAGGPQAEGLAVGVLAALRSVEGSSLLDRLIRGRAWIGLVAFALIGIVTLQLTLLKLNAGIGRALAQETTLQRQNSALSIEDSERAAGNLVESSAASLGMELVPVGALRFLSPHPRIDAVRAAAALRATVATSTASATQVGTPAGSSSEASGSSPTEASSSASSSQSTAAEATSTTSSGASSNAPGTSAQAAQGTSTTEAQAPESSSGASGMSPGQAPTTPAGGTQAAPAG